MGALGVVYGDIGTSPLYAVKEVFAEFDPEPVASASIAQAHLAKLPDGRPVIVKVQHPHVAAQLRMDLEILEALAALAEAMCLAAVAASRSARRAWRWSSSPSSRPRRPRRCRVAEGPILFVEDVNIDVEGVKGKACTDITKSIEEALGGDVTSRKKKPEFFDKETVKDKLIVGAVNAIFGPTGSVINPGIGWAGFSRKRTTLPSSSVSRRCTRKSPG